MSKKNKNDSVSYGVTLQNRYYYLDVLRAFLMLLGIIIHTSQVYSSDKNWLVNSTHTDVFFKTVITVISSFRMQVFFLLSGLLSYYAYLRLGSPRFELLRLKRIGVPLLSSSLILNVPILFVLSTMPDKKSTIIELLENPGVIQHLWFLLYLLIYTFLLFFSIHFLKCRFFHQNIKNKISSLSVRNYVLAVPFLWLAFLSLNILGIPIYESILSVSLYGLTKYFIFFLLGVLIAKEGVECFQNNQMAIMLILCSLILILADRASTNIKLLNTVTFHLAEVIIPLCASVTLMIIFNRAFNIEHKFITDISKASYSIYLLHHPSIILISIAMDKTIENPFFSFAITSFTAFAICYLLHKHLIKRYAFLSFILNGK